MIIQRSYHHHCVEGKWSSINIINSLITEECIEKMPSTFILVRYLMVFFVYISHWCCVVCGCFCTVKAHLPPWWPIQVPLGLPSRAIMIKRTCISLPKDSKGIVVCYITCSSMMTGIVSPCACMYIRHTLRANWLQHCITLWWWLVIFPCLIWNSIPYNCLYF